MKHQEMKQMSSDDNFNNDKRGEKIIKMLKEQRKDELEAKEHRKTFHKCLHKLLSLNRTRHAEHKLHEEVC